MIVVGVALNVSAFLDASHCFFCLHSCPTLCTFSARVSSDPYKACEGAHCIAVMTEWDSFKTLDYARIFASMVSHSSVAFAPVGTHGFVSFLVPGNPQTIQSSSVIFFLLCSFRFSIKLQRVDLTARSFCCQPESRLFFLCFLVHLDLKKGG